MDDAVRMKIYNTAKLMGFVGTFASYWYAHRAKLKSLNLEESYNPILIAYMITNNVVVTERDPIFEAWLATNPLSSKQDTLVSGENIKTINDQSILGIGNIEVAGTGGNTYYPSGW